MPRNVPGRGGRWVEQTSGEILRAYVYNNKEERWRRLLSGSVLFTLVALFFSYEWWGHIRYGVYGSLAVCC
jgi:hypothetical protein